MERKVVPALQHPVKHLASLQSHVEVLPVAVAAVRRLLGKIVLRRYLETGPQHRLLCRHAVSWLVEPRLLEPG